MVVRIVSPSKVAGSSAAPRRTSLRVALSAVLVPIALGVAGVGPAAPAAGAATSTPDGRFGSLQVATYNVAGLPAIISSGDPATNTAEIGRRINRFDVVNLQEDFNYHATLYSTDVHPYRTPTSGGVPFGSGLNTVSSLPFQAFTRYTWNSCSGTDCLSPKGFTFARVKLGPGAYVDLYNLHTNAGTSASDLAARRSNIRQLSAYMAARSGGNAVIVMGDTNTRYTRAGDNLPELIAANGLTDAWVQTQYGGVAPAAGSPTIGCTKGQETDPCEVVDKVLYRSGAETELRVREYRNEDAAFLDGAGVPLSDHRPVSVTFDWNSTMPRVALRSVSSGQCADVDWASQRPGARVVQYWCTPGADNQVFRLIGDTLRVAHTGMCLGIARASTAAGGTVEQYPCIGASNQRIAIVGDTIRFVHSGMCLDVPKATTTPSTGLIQWPCNGQANQRWSIA